MLLLLEQNTLRQNASESEGGRKEAGSCPESVDNTDTMEMS